MPSKYHTKIRFAAPIMLMVTVLQCVFVILDTGGAAHGSESTGYHHDTLFADVDPESKSTDKIADLDEIQTTDTCDHCCHCLGHGAHFPAPASRHLLIGGPSSARPLSDEPNPFSTYIQSIHRPPIA